MRTASLLAILAFTAVGCNPSPDKDDGSNNGEDPLPVNGKPIAEAGESINQAADSVVALTGSASSDPDGDPLTYHWAFDHVPEGSGLLERDTNFTVNDGAAAVSTSFSPDAVGTYVVRLVVKDDKGNQSDPDYVIITIEDPESVPVANAGTDLTASLGALVTLDGSRSYDPMGRSLTYAWSVVDKPTGSSLSTLTAADSAAPSFTPDSKGVYVLNLVVDNGLSASGTDAVAVTVLGDDGAPVANAGPDLTDSEDCTTIVLDCSASADPDGDPLQYMWELQSKPRGSGLSNASFSSRTIANPTIYTDVAGEYVVSCTVFDGTTWSAPDPVTITAAERRVNEPPTITAGTDLTVDGGSAACELDGYTYDCDECAPSTIDLGSTATILDADGDPYTIAWTTSSTSATILDPTVLRTTATLEDAEPSAPADCDDFPHEFTLTVSDCTGASVQDTVIYTVSCCGTGDTAESAR